MIKLAIIGLPLLLGAISTPAVENESYQVNEVSSQVQPKKVAYYDEDMEIELTTHETAYSFSNLYHWITETENWQNNISLVYNGNEYNYSSTDEGLILFDYNSSIIAFMVDYTIFDDDSVPLYNYYFFDRSYVSLLNDNLNILCGGTAYQDIKTAIEQDIIENSQTMPSISDMFGVVADSLQSFATTLGSAFTSVTALFWDSTASAPTFLGLLSLAVLGAGLIYLAFNLIRGLIRRIRG